MQRRSTRNAKVTAPETASTQTKKRKRDEDSSQEKSAPEDTPKESTEDEEVPIQQTRKRAKQLQHAAWYFEEAKVYDYTQVLNILKDNGCKDVPERDLCKRFMVVKTSDDQEIGIGFFFLGNKSYETHFCTSGNFTWSREHGQPNPADVKWGPSHWHIFASGNDVELEDVENAENDTTHFVYAGIAKWRSSLQGPGPEYLPSRVDFEMLRPKALSSQTEQKLGEHVLKCKKNKYGVTLCFIQANSDAARFGARPYPQIAPHSNAAQASSSSSSSSVVEPPKKSNSLAGLPLKVEDEPVAEAASAPPAGVGPLLVAATLPTLRQGKPTTIEKLAERNCVFESEDKQNPGVPVLNANAYGLKQEFEDLLSCATGLPQPIGIIAMFEPTQLEHFKYLAAYAAEGAPSLCIWSLSGVGRYGQFPDDCMSQLIAAIRDPKCCLDFLHFNAFAPSDVGLRSLVATIESVGRPQKLCFERFELTDDNMSVLCATIHKFKALSFVDCKLGAAHCEKLAAYIKSHNDSLISLDLTSNPVEQEGAVFLGGAIAGSSIEILDLSRTSIGAKGVIAMLKLMTGKTKIKIFRLDFVKLGPTGAKAVSDFLVGSHVEEISLASTGIPDHQWNLLKKGFDGAKKLKKVIVGKTEEKMSSAREMIAKYQ